MLAGCANVQSTGYSFRLKATVSVDGETRSGSSVIRVRYTNDQSSMNLGSRYRAEVWGEAPIVELGPKHGLLFVLLVGRFDETTGEYAFGPAMTSVSAFQGTKAEFRTSNAAEGEGARWRHIQSLSKRTEVVNVPQGEYPLFVRFADLADPQSVIDVDPMNLQGAYGPGVSLQSLTIQITNERETEGIRSVLPWLESLDETLGGKPPFERSKRTFAQTISDGHFRSWSP